MATPSAKMMEYANYFSGLTGVYPGVVCAWLAQEQGWWKDNPGNFNSNNPLNVTGIPGAPGTWYGGYAVRQYPGNPLWFIYWRTLKEGFEGNAAYLNANAGPGGWYEGIKKAVTPQGQIQAISDSVWAPGQYSAIWGLYQSLPDHIRNAGVPSRYQIPETNDNRQNPAPDMHKPGVGVPLPTPPPQPNPMSLLRPQNYLAIIIVAILFFVMLNKR